jgi:hypothetical protein
MIVLKWYGCPPKAFFTFVSDLLLRRLRYFSAPLEMVTKTANRDGRLLLGHA